MATQKFVLNADAPEFHPENKGKMHVHSHADSGGNTEHEAATTKMSDHSRIHQVPWTLVVGDASGSIRRDGEYTTIMIRNIPCNFTREMLADLLDKLCMAENEKLKAQDQSDQLVVAYDFLYLPMDFVNGKCLGYAFVNFTDSKAVWRIILAIHNKKWDHSTSKKICKIAYAKIMGKEQLLKNFRFSTFACRTDEWLPVIYNPPRDGSNNEVVEKKLVGMHVDPQHRGDVPRHGRMGRRTRW